MKKTRLILRIIIYPFPGNWSHLSSDEVGVVLKFIESELLEHNKTLDQPSFLFYNPKVLSSLLFQKYLEPAAGTFGQFIMMKNVFKWSK